MYLWGLHGYHQPGIAHQSVSGVHSRRPDGNPGGMNEAGSPYYAYQQVLLDEESRQYCYIRGYIGTLDYHFR